MARWFVVFGLLLTSTGCFHGSGPAPGQPGESPIPVVVNSDYALPVDVYVIGRGGTRRLGTVHPGIESTFQIPLAYLSPGGLTELEVRATDGPLFRSGDLLLAVGDIIDLHVGLRLFSSTATIRP